MKSSITLISFIFSLNTWGTTLWIKPIVTPLINFKTHILALGPQHSTYAQGQLDQIRQGTRKLFNLKYNIQKAQRFYLAGETELAKKTFNEITSVALQADFNLEQRRLILYAFLRQAQIELDSNLKKAILLQTASFMLEELTNSYPDYNLFPPPLIKTLNTIYHTNKILNINWKKLFPNHEIILVNGVKRNIDMIDNLKIGTYRMTALSSSHAPYVNTIRISSLISKKIKTQPLTKGVCQHLQIKEAWKQPHIKLFTPKNCSGIHKKVFASPYNSLEELLSNPDFINKKMNLNALSTKEKVGLGIGIGIAILAIGITWFVVENNKPNLIKRDSF